MEQSYTRFIGVNTANITLSYSQNIVSRRQPIRRSFGNARPIRGEPVRCFLPMGTRGRWPSVHSCKCRVHGRRLAYRRPRPGQDGGQPLPSDRGSLHPRLGGCAGVDPVGQGCIVGGVLIERRPADGRVTRARDGSLRRGGDVGQAFQVDSIVAVYHERAQPVQVVRVMVRSATPAARSLLLGSSKSPPVAPIASNTLNTSIGPPPARSRVDQRRILQRADARPRVRRPGPLIAHQVGHQQIGHRSPQPGHEVIAGVGAVAVVAAADDVVVTLGQRVEGLLGLGRTGAVEGRFTRGRPAPG